ncbi:MAG: translation initiation factor IF-2 subunit beta [Candidatus Micrarchaeota archaeon]
MSIALNIGDFIKKYEDLLDAAYKSIPKELYSGSRFEIMKLESFTEGTKTIVKNFGQAMDTIRRDRKDVMKFLSKELAVPINSDGDRLILQRKFFGDLINKKFEDYVNLYVLCKQCKKPDTHIEEIGHGVKNIICEACGARHSIK